MAVRDFNLPPYEPGKPELVPPRRHQRWRTAATWILGILTFLILIVVIGIYALLHSSRFHNYLLATAQEKAGTALNTRVQLQNFVLHPHNLGLDLYGLTIYGVGPGANQPLLQVDHIGLGVRVLSLLHRQWNLDNVNVDHPVVSLIVDKQGNTNLPTPQPSSGNSQTNLFDLAIRHILLEGGQVYYNDRKSALDADLHDLLFQSNFDAGNGGHYIGNLSYRNGHLKYGEYAPIPHDLQAQFDAGRTAFHLNNLTLKSDGSQVLLNATLENYSSPKVQAKYVVMLATGEFRRILRNPSLPAGVIVVNGTADYTSVPGRAPLDTAVLQGTIRSGLLQLRTPSLRTDIRDFRARYSLQNGNAEVRDLYARLLGGEVTGAATVRDIAGKQQGKVVASLHGISLAELKPMTNSASLQQVTITGNVNANAEANWSGSAKSLAARADAAAEAKVAPAQNSGAALPLNAMIHARYSAPAQELALQQSYLRTPQTLVQMNGTLSQRSALQVQVHANDLHELETVADAFRTAAPGQPQPQPLGLQGRASFDGAVRGSTSAPQISGVLTANDVQFRNTAVRLLRTNLQASPSQVSLQNGDLELARQGRVTFSLQTGLHDWSHTPESPFVANINVSQLSLADLARAANSTTPISGTVTASLAAHGTQLNPIGQGQIALRNAIISGEPIQAADVHFQGTGDAVHANLLVRISAGTAQGQLTYYPKQQGYDALLQATNIHLAQIQSLRARNLQLTGTMDVRASGRGTLKDPQGQVSLTIPQLGVQGQQINDVRFNGGVANHEATFRLTSELVKTPLQAQGKVALNGDYYADASFDTPVIALQPLLAVYAPAQAANLSGQTEVHATLRGPLKNKALLEAHLNIPTLNVSYRAPTTTGAQPVIVQIAAVTPIRADYANGVLALQPGEIKGTDTDVHFQGNLPLNSNAAATLTVQGAVDLGVVELFQPDLTSHGQLQFDINAAGSRNDPNVEGQVRIVNASFATPDAPVGLSNGNGVLTLKRDRLEVTKFTGEVGGGKVEASGAVAYRPAVQFYLGLWGSGLRLLYPSTVRTDFDTNLTMTGTADNALLQGQVNINRIAFTPDFDLMTFANQFGGAASPPPSQGFADNLKLNIALRSTSELDVVSPTVSLQGEVNLRVIGTANDPVIVGRTNLNGGDIIALGNRYVLQGGTIAFVNTTETRPILNLQVSTTIQQYNIAMRFQGPLDRLHTNYTSDPALPAADIIHLVAFGNTEEAANAAPSQSATLGAEGLLASQVTGQITNRVQKVAGISQLSVDPQLGNNGNQPPGARITVQQRVTGKLFVTFTTDVTATQNTAIQGQYRFNRKWSASAVRDQNGGFGLDGRYHKEF